MEKKTVLRLLLRRWGTLDPNDTAVLDAVEKESGTWEVPQDDSEGMRETIDDLKGREQEEEPPRSVQDNMDVLGFETTPEEQQREVTKAQQKPEKQYPWDDLMFINRLRTVKRLTVADAKRLLVELHKKKFLPDKASMVAFDAIVAEHVNA